MRNLSHFVFVLPLSARQPQRPGYQLEAMPACTRTLTRFGGRIMLYHFK